MRRHLGHHLDVAVRASWRRRADLAVTDYQVGAPLGAGLFDNTWIEVGYNVDGVEDDDFSAAGFLARGPCATFRLKVDQATLRELLR